MNRNFSRLIGGVLLLLGTLFLSSSSRADEKQKQAKRQADFAARIEKKRAEAHAQLAKKKIEVRAEVVRRDDNGQIRRTTLEPRHIPDGGAAKWVHEEGQAQVTKVGQALFIGADSLDAEVRFNVSYSKNPHPIEVGTMIEVKALLVPAQAVPTFLPPDGYMVEVNAMVRKAVEPWTETAQVISGCLTTGVYRVDADEVIKVVLEKGDGGKPREWLEVSVRAKE